MGTILKSLQEKNVSSRIIVILTSSEESEEPNGVLFSYHDLIRYFCAEKVWGSSVITFNLKH
jgi:hypothetical protein